MARAPKAEAAGFFVLRTPLVPFDVLASLAEAPWPRLRALFAGDAVIREAIFIASPELYDAHGAGEPPPRVQRSLLRYLSRMASRATPFGLLAGVARGSIADETRLTIDETARARRYVRLDHGYLSRLVEQLAARPEVRESLLCVPNETLYAFGGELRYIESRIENRTHTYRLATLAPDEPLLATLRRARGGATLSALAHGLTEDDPEIELDDAAAYVSELLAQDVLRHDLAPTVTGLGALDQIRASLRAKGIPSPELDEADARLRAISRAPIGAPPDDYRALAESSAAGKDALQSGALVQVDLAVSAPELTLGRRAVQDMLRGVAVLHRLFGRAADQDLEAFRDRFRERFDRREVPLMEALDADSGISFGADTMADTPLIDGLPLPRKPAPERLVRGGLEELLQRKIHEALTRRVIEVELTQEEVDAVALPEPPPLPRTFAVHGALLAEGNRLSVRVDGITGASGGRLLGRFCAALPELRDDLHRYLELEREPDTIHAEIVHIPTGRLVNVSARPIFHDYEIPLIGRSGAPAERQIAPDDLRLSLVGDELVLRSSRLGRRIVPRLTSAHNYHRQDNLPVYRFLCKLQGQGEAANFTWSWRGFEDAPFLPRVRFGRTVLARAQWTVPASRLDSAAAVAETRASLELPRFIEHARLVIDLENALAVEDFVRSVRRLPRVVVREFDVRQSAVSTPAAMHVNEVVVPMVSEAIPSHARPRKPLAARTVRSFPPGSEWTYLKLYTSTASADALLAYAVMPAVRALLRSGAAQRWFFARYADPDPHLRIRVHGDPPVIARALNDAVKTAFETGVVWRVQYDTYDREIERYGGPAAIVLAEELFHHDSDVAVALVSAELSADARWRATLSSVHALLEAMVDEPEARQRITGLLRKSFTEEFEIDAAGRKEIGRRFRELSPELTSDDCRVVGILQCRTSAVLPVLESLRALREREELTVSWEQFVISCVHMSVNRLLASQQRTHELVLYDFLDRRYQKLLRISY